jgi:outer membrane biosynthesis protein TonB
MNPLKKFTIAASAAIPAIAMFAGVAGAAPVDHITNGTFNINSKAWTPGANASVTKHVGFPIGVLTNETNGGQASSVTASQCVTLYNGLPSYFEGRVMIPSNQERTGSAAFVVTLYSDPNCGVPIKQVDPGMFHTTQDWKKFEFTLPSGAESASVSMAVTKGKSLLKPNAEFMAFFDDIKLVQHPLMAVPAAEDESPEPPAPSEEPANGDAQVAPDEPPVEEDPPAEAPEAEEPAPEVPAEEEPADTDEPAPAPQEPAAEPAPQLPQEAPAESDTNESDSDSGEAPGAPATGSTEPPMDEPEAVEAETSEQHELPSTNADVSDGGDGQDFETPDAPETGFTVANTRDLVGADELGLFGGVLAFFGLALAAVAIKRERSTN